MLVGVPKEIKDSEYRVGLVPSTVHELTLKGHRVLVEKDAGVGAGLADDAYVAAGAMIAESADRVFAVLTEGDTALARLADHKIEVPETLDVLTPVLTVLPLQLLAYYIAVRRGCNVDQPRNLAKSVTVE